MEQTLGLHPRNGAPPTTPLDRTGVVGPAPSRLEMPAMPPHMLGHAFGTGARDLIAIGLILFQIFGGPLIDG